jgi:LysR family transcriptional regulator, regulator for bpeEF and oprC
VFLRWNNTDMLDLNDFRVFEKVAKLKSFSAAARALGLPKSSVSRCVARLEDEVGIRLIQRTTRSVQLRESGLALEERCVAILASARETIDYISSLGTKPKGASESQRRHRVRLSHTVRNPAEVSRAIS